MRRSSASNESSFKRRIGRRALKSEFWFCDVIRSFRRRESFPDDVLSELRRSMVGRREEMSPPLAPIDDIISIGSRSEMEEEEAEKN